MKVQTLIIACLLASLLVGCSSGASKQEPQVQVGIEKLPADAAKWASERRDAAGLDKKTFGQLDVYVIAAGEKPSGGYSVKIDGWENTSAHGLVVTATLVAPGAGQIVTQALTYPTAVFAVGKGMPVKVVFSNGGPPQQLPVKGN